MPDAQNVIYPRGRGIQGVDHHVSPGRRIWNPNMTFDRDAGDNITGINAIQAGVTYTKAVTRNGCGSITAIGPWVEA